VTSHTVSGHDTAMLLGEMKAQLRELVHQGNNQAMKNDAFVKTLAKLETLPADIAEIKERLTKLEASEHQRDGERGLLATVLQSPLVQWAATLAVALYVWWKGHGQ
jgi:hypothetical protein